jgi:phospholipid N-methyltransferase
LSILPTKIEGMFTIEAIKTLKNSGTVAPSSKFLVKKMTKPIDNSDNVIVEFGTGNGVITEGILDKITNKSQIISFELNETMYQDAKESLPEDVRLQLLNSSALEFDKVLKEQKIEKVDYFISSLPLSLFKKSDIHNLMTKVTQLLNYGGMFIQYQYSLGKRDLLKEYFPSIRLGFTPLNFPPAFIYYCTLAG